MLCERRGDMKMFAIINGVLVTVFGIVLSAAFCDIQWTRKKTACIAGCVLLLFVVQGIFYFSMELEMVRYYYPFIIHVPLIFILYAFYKKWLWVVSSVLTAYLCCQLRRWLALFVVELCSGREWMQDAAEVVITFPLLFVLVKYIAPAVRSVSQESVRVQYQYSLIPALYYGFDYLTRIYANSMWQNSPVIVEFMQFICSVAYLVFILSSFKEKRVRNQLEHTQRCLNLQVTQAVREIEMLRESQQWANTYRHDLRHHLQYLLSCIENERLEQAQNYIQSICKEMEANKVTVYCQNEAVNLIFSAYDKRAKVYGIVIKIKAAISQTVSVSEKDLCVLLSNALENALHACQKQKEKGKDAVIEVTAFEKKGKLCFQIVNSCGDDVVFKDGIPVTSEPGHGVGVLSILALVERNDGFCTFAVEKGKFILRISL